MPTTTATLTLNSADLTGDALALSTTATLTKAESTVGMDQFTGVARKIYAAATTADNIVAAATYADNKAHKVYIKNLSTSQDEFVTIEVGGSNVALGRLYGGDWAFFPYDGTNDIDIDTSHALTIEYAVIYQA
jgi:hypothetical protein|tara:strand:- start:805 stop:1203 length:399 start_codon:yes stop_codon:yes gene_type:complete